MRTNRSWNWKLSVLKTVKVMLVRPLMTNFKVTVRADCAVSECSPLSQPTKALSNPLIVSGGSHPSDRCLPSPTGCQNPNKANFPFHQPGLLIGFWAAGPHCGLRHKTAPVYMRPNASYMSSSKMATQLTSLLQLREVWPEEYSLKLALAPGSFR